jgi:hypothetical protein
MLVIISIKLLKQFIRNMLLGYEVKYAKSYREYIVFITKEIQ